MAETKRKMTLWNAAFGILCAMPLLMVATRAGADVAASLIAVLFLVHSRKHRDWGWIKHTEIRLLAALWVFMMLASWFTPLDPASSFMFSAIWVRFVLFYAAIRYWLLRTQAALLTLARMGFLIFVFSAIDTIWQYNMGVSLSGRPMISDRLTGALSNANIGNFLLKTGMPVMGLLSYHFIVTRQTRYLWLTGAGMLTILSLVAVSGERSTAVLVLLSLAVIGSVLFIFQPQLRRKVLIATTAITALLAVLTATQPIIMGKAVYFAEQVADFKNTYYGQLFIASGKLALANPLTGVGPKQFLKACEPEVLDVTYCDVHPHNFYFEWLAATGLPGLALFVAAMLVIALRLLREAVFKGHELVLTAFAFAQVIVVLFPFVVTQSAFSNWPAILFWYSLALGASLMHMAAEKKHG